MTFDELIGFCLFPLRVKSQSKYVFFAHIKKLILTVRDSKHDHEPFKQKMANSHSV